MAEVVMMSEPRSPMSAMAELAESIVRARQCVDELLALDPHAAEPSESLLSERQWSLLEEDLTGWRYQLSQAIAVLASHTDCVPVAEICRTRALRGEMN
jgi:hypothetical protein